MTEYLRGHIVARLDAIAARVEELLHLVSTPEVLESPERMRSVQKELGSSQRIATTYSDYSQVVQQIEDNRSLASDGGDAELAELAAAELPELEARASALADDLIDGLLSEASQGDRNAIVEIRAGTGGEEAALWARDLFDM